MRARTIVLMCLALVQTVGALVDSSWALSMCIGRSGTKLPDGWQAHTDKKGRAYYYNEATQESTWTRPPNPSAEAAFLGPPLAMFTPGGGRAELPSWFEKGWGRSGAELDLPLEVDFFPDDYGPISDEPLRRTQARQLYARRTQSSSLDTKANGVAWGLVQLSSIQAMLVFSLDLPEGACSGDVTLPAGSRLYCSTQVWRGDELDRLQPRLAQARADFARATDADERRALTQRIKKLEVGLPRPGAPTIEVPGMSEGSVTISTHGQVAVQRSAPTGRMLNPFENAGRFPNPFENVVQFGVVGSFVLAPLGGRTQRLATSDSDADAVEIVVE